MIGPSIPEHLLKAKREREEKETEEAQEAQTPPADSTPQDQEEDDDGDDADAFAPALPPDLLEARQKQKQNQESQPKRRVGPVGPTLPPGLQRSYHQGNTDEDDDDYVVGPSLPSNYDPEQESKRSAIAAIEARAQQSREAMDEAARDAKSKKVERDEWMLLPPEIDYLRNADSSKSRGFNNRQLSESERDRSIWTDSPAERERKRKAAMMEEPEDPRQQQQRPAPKPAAPPPVVVESRGKTLVEIHKELAKNKKLKRKEDEDDPSKRPFDREKDLMAARPMNRKTKQDLLKSSYELGGRFNRGNM
ncbi:hypothetical protein BCR43DRAFT_513662 [Syncephalastrum racemosum]|uniref:DUF3752 domain-containing protein n=1 Tax=Syncephalastrum racemosum TaxID=13706 RepID=A0A1X2HE79_SYNRA|nr:hypothetical protein BCR43DRAFT_513662 [Syncephalastrum racemosum]